MPRTLRSFYVLLALNETPAHGYAIRKKVLDLSDQRCDLDPSTLYRLIARLESDGFVTPTDPPEDTASTDPRRRYYGLTTAGRAALGDEAGALDRLLARPEIARLRNQGA